MVKCSDEVIRVTKNELKKISRADLLEMLIEQSEEVQKLRKKLDEAEAKLSQRELIVNEAGSIAEASLKLNGIFETAQAASQQYLESIRLYSDYQKLVCEKREKQIKEDAERYMAEVKRKSELLEKETKQKCTEMLLKARVESQSYWDDIIKNIEICCSQDPKLRDMLAEIALPSERK